MLYAISYELLHARAARAEQHCRLKANFERDAAMIQRRIPLPIVDGKTRYRITIRNPVTGETNEAFFRPNTTDGSFFHTVREMFNQPVKKHPCPCDSGMSLIQNTS